MLGHPWVLVLGCTVGAGGAIASRVLTDTELGVIGVHRGNHPEEAAALQALAQAHGRECVLIQGDAGRLENIPALLSQIQEALQGRPIRLMVHACADASAAPIVHEQAPKRLHPKQILKTFEVMAHSFLFWGQSLVVEGLMEKNGQLLALPNTMDELVASTFCAVGAAKAALSMYVRYMAVELGPHGVRVNGLRFGATPTPAFSRMPTYEATLSTMRAINPMGRTTEVQDVANFVMLLLDPRSGWLNGSIIDFDGGEHLAVGEFLFGQRA